jgi:hypothetical protein
MPSHGDGEQSTKFGGPCPNCSHPPLCCKFESELSALAAAIGVMVTVAVPDWDGAATLVAEIVTVVFAVTCGAVYRPELEIAPCVALQLTSVFDALLTSALSCVDPPDGTDTVAGVTMTEAATAALVAFDTAICNDCSFEIPLESRTETAKLKFPLALGIPETTPVLSPSPTPGGS